MKTTRTYTMRARAAAVEETRRRILQATFDLAADRLVSEIALDDVAGRSGVSVQTVLRHFDSRAGLIRATTEFGASLVAQERRAPAGDLAEAVRLLVDHYELRGDTSVLLLAQEGSDETIGAVVARGREVHRDWVTDTFQPLLAHLEPVRREEAHDLLAVVTDVYTWKQLRRDQHLSREATEARITTLVAAVLAATDAHQEARDG
jgi:AcrR family transcriptional regulator